MHALPPVHARERGAQRPGRPQLVGIAEVLRLSARQRHQPRLGLQRDRRFPAGARAIVERSQRAFGHGALDAALDGLMMQPERPTDRKKRRVFPIGQQYPRPLDPVCRFGSRLRDRSQLRCFRISKRQFNRSPPRCHDTYYPAPSWAHVTYIGVGNPDQSPLMTIFIIFLVRKSWRPPLPAGGGGSYEASNTGSEH